MRKVNGVMRKEESAYVKNTVWVLDTTGTNLLQVLALDTIDVTRTVSNDIQEIYRVLGIEAARVAILNELMDSFDTTYINHHHLIYEVCSPTVREISACLHYSHCTCTIPCHRTCS